MIAGTLVGAIYPETLRWETSFGTTIKRLFQFIICFGYYYFYRYYFTRRKININKILFVFTIVTTLFAIYFLVSPKSYANIKIYLNPVDNHTMRYLAGTHYYRFNYLWTDPNNIAYLADGIVMWFILDRTESFKNRMIILLLSSVIILATSSNGGMAILGIELALIIVMKLLDMKNTAKLRLTTLIGIFASIVAAIIVVRFTPLYDYIQTELIDKWVVRWTIYSGSSNLSGGRLNDLKAAVSYINPMLLVIGAGKEGFSSENGHIYWIGMYGFPAYLCFIYLCFAKFKNVKWSNYIWILPFFFAFTFNIAIGEFKWLAIYFLLLAHSRYCSSEEVL